MITNHIEKGRQNGQGTSKELFASLALASKGRRDWMIVTDFEEPAKKVPEFSRVVGVAVVASVKSNRHGGFSLQSTSH